jgi:hypothetical protein
MIDFQSTRLTTSLCRRLGSPKGCGKLAGGATPGSPSPYPCALKGRWKRIHFRCRFILFGPLPLPKAFQGSQDILPSLSKTDARAFQGPILGYSKPIQGVPSLSKPFSKEKKIVYFLSASFPLLP